MAITPAIITIAADVPNPTFSRPSDSNNVAAEWTADAGVASTALYSGLPRIGHQRAQRYEATASKNVTGGMVTPGKFCANVATLWYTAALVRISGLSGGNAINYQIRWFDANGAGLGAGYRTLLTLANAADWTVISGTMVLTPEPGAHHCRTRLNLVWAVGTITLDIAFVSFGTYDGTNGSHTLARVFSVGTSMRVTEGAQRRIIGALNLPSFVDRDRFSRPIGGQLVCSGVPTAMRDALDYVWQMNKGRAWEAGGSNPAGGCYPFMLIGNGMPTLPMAGVYDFEGADFPLDAAPVGWLPESPDWSGVFQVRERL